MDNAFSLVANSRGPERVERNKGKGYVDKCNTFHHGSHSEEETAILFHWDTQNRTTLSKGKVEGS